MKKLAFGIMFLVAGSLKAATLGDQITTTLTEHVSAHTQYTTSGENRLALLDAVVLIGHYNGSAIAQVRAGFTGIMNPDKSVTPGAGYVVDVYANAAPLIRKFVNLSQEWTFLNDVEIGPSLAYDFRQHHSYLSVSVGLAFGLAPKP